MKIQILPSTPKRYWWLSFADDRLPVGEQFLGVVMIQGDSFEGALLNVEAAMLLPNASGRAIGYPCTPLDLSHVGRLLSVADLEALGYGTRRMTDKEYETGELGADINNEGTP